MGGCSVPGCNSSTRKGYKLYQFPRDPLRRQTWIDMSNCPNWNPGVPTNATINSLRFWLKLIDDKQMQVSLRSFQQLPFFRSL